MNASELLDLVRTLDDLPTVPTPIRITGEVVYSNEVERLQGQIRRLESVLISRNAEVADLKRELERYARGRK
jgi:hypothetical protein